MKFIHALELIDLCVKNEILQDVNGVIPVYRERNADNKEGWYLIRKHDLAQELMRDVEGEKLLISSLKEKNVDFLPSVF